MKKTMKRITAVFLALALLTGMASMFSVGASAASDDPLTLNVTSNCPNLFGNSEISIAAGTERVTVTYYINTPDYRIMNSEWLLTYSSDALTPDFKTEGINFSYDEDGGKYYRLLRFTPGLSNGTVGQVVNEDSASGSDAEHNIKAICGNVTNTTGFNTVADEKREFLSVTFRVKKGAPSSANVNLVLKTIQVCPRGGNYVYDTCNLVYQSSLKTEVFETVDPPTYQSTADPLNLPKPGYGYSMVLQDDIKLKVYISDIPQDTELNDYRVEVTYKGNTRTSEDDDTLCLTNYNDNGLVLANCAAPEMTEEALLRVIWKGIVIRSRKFSVADYCKTLINTALPQSQEKFKDLARATLSYGAASQALFGVNTDRPADADDSLGCTPATERIPADYSKRLAKTVNFPRGVNFEFSLVLNSKTELNIYITSSTEAAAELMQHAEYTVTGTENYVWSDTVEGKKLKISKISPPDLDNTYTVKVKDSNGTDYRQLTLSALSYLYLAQDSDDAALRQVALEMYRYCLQAKACFQS